MVSVVEEGQQQQHHYLQQLESSSPYSLFVLAIRSPQTKEKYLQRFGYFLDFVKIGIGRPFEERCNILGELAKNDPKWITNCIFNYLQLLKNRVEAKEIKLPHLEITSSLSSYSADKWILNLLGKGLDAECLRKENTQVIVRPNLKR
jgi:hypothetical protein